MQAVRPGEAKIYKIKPTTALFCFSGLNKNIIGARDKISPLQRKSSASSQFNRRKNFSRRNSHVLQRIHTYIHTYVRVENNFNQKLFPQYVQRNWVPLNRNTALSCSGPCSNGDWSNQSKQSDIVRVALTYPTIACFCCQQARA